MYLDRKLQFDVLWQRASTLLGLQLGQHLHQKHREYTNLTKLKKKTFIQKVYLKPTLIQLGATLRMAE